MSTNKQTRGWCFTLNNYTEEEEQSIKRIECVYMVFGHEVAPSTETRHLQGYVYFSGRGLRFNTVKEKFPVRVHLEKCKGTSQQNFEYCTKEDSVGFFEKGERPLSANEKGKIVSDQWDEARELARKGDIEKIPAELYIRYYGAFKAIKRDHMPKVDDASDVCGVWICGPAGCGKSRYARLKWAQAFLKPCNKWWDGYDGEENVILDDVDPHHNTWIGYFLKMWTDRYAFVAEQKGTSIRIRPKHFVITSQYYIDQVFTGDKETCEALTRRCTLVDMNCEVTRLHCNAYTPPIVEDLSDIGEEN